MNRPIHLWAIEDDAIDSEALERYFRAQTTQFRLTVKKDASTALHELQAQVRQPFPVLPHLILLDLNLPGLDGLTFLRILRQDPILRHLLVFILTTSELTSDKAAAYQMGVAGYILKKNLPAFLPFLNDYCMLIEVPAFPLAYHT